MMMRQATRGGLYVALALCASVLCTPAANAADDKPKAATSDKAPAKSASAPNATAKSKKAEGEKTGTAAPSSTDTDQGGNISGMKKPSPPKIPQDAAAKKSAVKQQ
jgi:hypothetical protein